MVFCGRIWADPDLELTGKRGLRTLCLGLEERLEAWSKVCGRG